jgi:hypothetical protein
MFNRKNFATITPPSTGYNDKLPVYEITRERERERERIGERGDRWEEKGENGLVHCEVGQTRRGEGEIVSDSPNRPIYTGLVRGVR